MKEGDPATPGRKRLGGQWRSRLRYIRTDLPTTQKTRLIARRVQIVRELNPEPVSRHSATEISTTQRSSGRPRTIGSARDTASKIGISPRQTERATKRVEVLGDKTLNDLTGSTLDSHRELDALVKTPKPERDKLIERARAYA